MEMMTEEEIAAAVKRLDKPRMWAPCNGCGMCCTLELCHVAEAAFGPMTAPPCPAMEFDGERFRCGMVTKPSRYVGSPESLDGWFSGLISKSLGIGEGCGAPDE